MPHRATADVAAFDLEADARVAVAGFVAAFGAGSATVAVGSLDRASAAGSGPVAGSAAGAVSAAGSGAKGSGVASWANAVVEESVKAAAIAETLARA